MSKAYQSTDESEPLEAPRRGRPLRRVALGILACIVLVVAAGGGLYWRATTGSISLGFISGRVEAALRERLPADARVAVGSTAFSYREGQGVILRIKNLELVLPGTARVAAAEVATRTTASALMSGRIDLQSVTASGVEIGVTTPERLPRDGSAADLMRRASKLIMDQALEADTLIRGAGLREVVVRDATVNLDDEGGPGAGAPLKIAEANWVPLGAGRSKVWMQVVETDGHDWDLTLERRKLNTGESSLTMEIEDLPLASLAPALAGRNGGPYFRAALTLQARMAEAADGSFLGLRGIISTSDGQLSVTGLDEMNVESIALNFVLDESGDRIAIPNGELRTRTGRGRFEGVADLSEPGYVTLLARVRDGSLPTPIGDAGKVRLIGGGGMARIDFANLGIEVDQFSLMTPEGTASIIGQASLAGETPGLSLALSITQMPAAVMRAFWPPFIVGKTRGWFDINVKGGTLGPATLQVALPPENIGVRARGKILPDYALVGQVPFQEAEFSPIKNFPTIKNSVGGITFGNATASIWAQSGIVQVAGKGDLEAGGTTLIIPELGRSQPRGDLHLELAGSAAALAAVSNTPPLAIAAKKGIVPESLTGNAVLSLDANIPIYESNFADVTPTFRLALTDFTSTEPIDSRLIGEADLVLEGNPKSYTVKGTGTLDGLDATVDLILGTGAPQTSAVSISLDDETRERLGFGLGNLLTGPMLASVTHPDEARQEIALDLKETRISLPFLGWEKGPGVPATASFLMEKTATGREITNFQLSGKGFEARGALSFGLDGRLRSMELEKLSLRPGDQLSVSATADGGGYDVNVRGAALDARGILQGVRAGATGGSADIFPIAISLNVEVVTGQNDVALSNVRGKMTVTRKGLDAASLKGNSGSNQPFEWTLGREGDTRVLRLFADGGGALIRFSGIYSRVAGGNLIIDYSGPVGGAGAGVAVMRDFRLLNEAALKPAINTVTSNASRGGVEQANAETTNELQFSQLKIPFRQEGWVITIADAALRGSTLGATASGTVNIPGGKIAISGAFIPAFGLNNAPGAIPLFGGLFGGRDGGLFGITYRLFGPLDGPQLTMNPISALAPGIFRKIFEYR